LRLHQLSNTLFFCYICLQSLPWWINLTCNTMSYIKFNIKIYTCVYLKIHEYTWSTLKSIKYIKMICIFKISRNTLRHNILHQNYLNCRYLDMKCISCCKITFKKTKHNCKYLSALMSDRRSKQDNYSIWAQMLDWLAIMSVILRVPVAGVKRNTQYYYLTRF